MENCEPRLHVDVDLRGACKGLARFIANRQNYMIAIAEVNSGFL